MLGLCNSGEKTKLSRLSLHFFFFTMMHLHLIPVYFTALPQSKGSSIKYQWRAFSRQRPLEIALTL